MALVCRCRIPLALEDMTQVPATIGADDFNPRHPQCPILVTGNSAWYAVKICRPTASRLELLIGLVQRGLTSCAGVDTLLRMVLIELARTRRLGALLPEDAKLFCNLVVSKIHAETYRGV